MARRRARTAVAATTAAALIAPLAGMGAAAAAPTSGPTVVVSGLNNPRQLSLSDTGALFIAEAGDGGSYKITLPHQGVSYIGPSGSISEVADPATASGTSPVRVATGFLSSANAQGQQAVGSDGVAASEQGKALWVQETYFPPLPSFFPNQSGNLYSVTVHGGATTAVANISAYEAAHDPDGQGVASDPYAVLRRPISHTELVADAAGNDVLKVDSTGTVSLWHVFPNVLTGPCAHRHDPTPAFPGCNFVPNALATDAAGHVFVAGLASLVPGQGQVVELNSTGTTVLATWSGLTAPDGLAVGPDGSIYVSELLAKSPAPAPGLLTRISGASRSSIPVPLPSGLALDPSGNLYVSAFSIAPSTGLGIPGADTSGQVWRLAPGSL